MTDHRDFGDENDNYRSIGKGPVAISAEISKTFYPLVKKALEDYQNASVSHDVGSGGSEIEKTGGSEP